MSSTLSTVGWPLALAALAAGGPEPVDALGWLAAVAAGSVAALIVVRGRRRATLVAEAGHELRGPLCAARLALEAVGRAGPDGARHAAAIDLELRRAARAAEDLVASARGARGGDTLEVVDVAALAREAAAGWHAVARAHGAGLALAIPAEPAVVEGDPVRIAQALGNLVANAAEHGGGAVSVAVRPEEHRVRIEVTDAGPGLPAPVAALAAAGRSRREPRGHGLAIAEGIARRHGGRLAAAPAAAGARLVLELPCRASSSEARP
jgi:signal transduction histidine kinase